MVNYDDYFDDDEGFDLNVVRTSLDWIDATYVNRFIQVHHKWIIFDEDGFPDASTLWRDDDNILSNHSHFKIARDLYYLRMISENPDGVESERIKDESLKQIREFEITSEKKSSKADRDRIESEVKDGFVHDKEGYEKEVIKGVREVTKKEIQELLWKQEHPQLEERMLDIFEEAEDFLPRLMHAIGIDPQIHVHTVRLMETVVQVAYAVAMHFKRALERPRPSQLSAKLYPAILVPAHYAFPSGHSTQANAVKEALFEVFRGKKLYKLNWQECQVAHLERITRDIAENREWAGVHYASDTDLGRSIGKSIWHKGYSGEKAVFKELLAAAQAEWK